MAGELAQLGQPGQCPHPLIALGGFRIAIAAQFGDRGQPRIFVAFAFFAAHLGIQRDFGPLGQFRQHGGLGPPQNEWPHQVGERLAAFVVLVPLDRFSESRPKTFPRAKQAGAERAEQAPEFSEVIFQRCAGEPQPPIGLDRADGLRCLGRGVLDELGFVQHECVPTARGEPLGIALQQLVADDHQIAGLRRIDQVLAVVFAVGMRRE